MIPAERINAKRLAEAGQQLYEEKLRRRLEPRSEGRIVVIDVESGDHFLGDNLHEANHKARKKYPGRVFYAVRVGHPAVYSFASHLPVTATL